MKKILLILGNPKTKSLCRSLADAYEKEAKKAGAEIRRINIGDLKFNPVLKEGYDKIQKLEPDLKKAQDDIRWADHLVFVFPSWWASMPAVLKGFIDRVFLPGFAFNFRPGKLLPAQHLKGKTGRLLITMGAPRFVYWGIFCPGAQIVKMGTFYYCGIKPTRVTLFPSIAPDRKYDKYIEKARKLGARLK
ncbi:TPA: NAD(P)H-dependent oxidoreductase [Candidatus Woesearchaeota archaeon]|nr:NAD(P)H-dependent oxidoreductase [Candidatus Woesearchaeota archaeon]